jgi:hypothetical protein
MDPHPAMQQTTLNSYMESPAHFITISEPKLYARTKSAPSHYSKED